MKKTIALAAAAVIGFAAWAASAQPYAPAPSDNLLFAQTQAPKDGTAAKAAKAKKKSDAKAKAAAKSKKSDPKKASKKKAAKKKAAAPPPS